MLAELKLSSDKSAAQILPFIVSKSDVFAGGAKQHDDEDSLLILREGGLIVFYSRTCM